MLTDLQNSIIMACGSSDVHSSRGISLDNDPRDKTRLSFYQLTVGDPTEAVFQKVGEWYLEGRVEGTSLHLENGDF
jgi:hypothetical protein